MHMPLTISHRSHVYAGAKSSGAGSMVNHDMQEGKHRAPHTHRMVSPPLYKEHEPEAGFPRYNFIYPAEEQFESRNF
jgi:hypothetical protein